MAPVKMPTRIMIVTTAVQRYSASTLTATTMITFVITAATRSQMTVATIP